MRPVAVLSVMVNAKGVGSTRAGLRAVQGQLTSTGTAGERMGKQIAQGAKWASLGVGAGLGFAVKKAADFEQQIDSLGSVTSASAKQMDQFRKQAMKAGADTKFSALDAAVAQTELAKGGLSVQRIMRGGLRSALALAAAGEMDLGAAAATTANTLKLFGLRGRDAMKVADALATAANSTTADVSDFALALRQGGAAARIAGLGLTGTVGILEALAEAGVKGSDAGTSLKAFFLNIATPSKKATKAMRDLGVNIFDTQGNLKKLPALSQNLRKAFGDLTREQFLNKAGVIAGSDAIRTLYALYNAGPEKLRKLQAGLQKQGTATDVAAKKQDNLKGKLENLRGSIETIAIGIGSKMIPALSDAAVAINKILNNPNMTTGEKFDRLTGMISKTVNKGLQKATDLAVQYGPKIAGALATGFISWWSGANPITKILGLAAIIRLLGGKGAITASGAAIGRWLGGGITAGAATATVAGGGGGVAAGGILGGLVTKLKGIAPRAGIAAVGILLADQLMKNFSNGVAAKSGDIFKELKQKTDPGLGGSIIESVFGKSDVTVAGQALSKSLDDIAKHSRAISPDKAAALRKQLALLGDVTPKAQRQFDQLINTAERRFHDGAAATSYFNHAVSDMVRDSRGKLGGMATNVAYNTKLIRKALKDDSGAGRTALANNMAGILSTIRHTMSRGGKITAEGMGLIKQLFINELQMYGLSPRQALAGANVRTGEVRGGRRRQDFQRGGYIDIGKPTGDSVPAMLEKGEGVINRRAVKAMGGPGAINAINSTVSRFQTGGVAGMVSAANQLDRAQFPYKWGGGHQGSPAPFGAMDCSGAVSYVLQHGGVQIPTMVSGALAGAGKPGPGAVTVFANPTHTFMRLGQRYFGTSGSNPGGGAGWFPDPGASYRARFTQRHFAGKGGFGSIPRVVVRGRDSLVKSDVQGALDNTRHGANKRLHHVMMTPIGSGDPGDPGPSLGAAGRKKTRSGRNRGHGFQKGGVVASAARAVGGIHNSSDWARAQLDNLKIGRSATSIADLVTWAAAEGGHWHNLAKYNPLNTTQPMPGAGNTGAQGNIKVYKSWPQGILATSKTLHNGNYGGILNALAKGNYGQFRSAVVASPWGTKAFPSSPSAVVGSVGGGGSVPDPNRLSRAQRRKLRHPFKGSLGTVLNKTLKVLRTSPSSKVRGIRLRQFEQRIRKVGGLPKPVSNQLTILSKAAEIYGDYADKASQLNVDNGDGTTTLGSFRGAPEGQWLLKQLDALFKWRNKIVDAVKIIAKRRVEVRKLIVKAQKRLEQVKADISSVSKFQNKRRKDLAALQKHPKRNKSQIDALKGTIKTVDKWLGGKSRERKLLGDRILPALGGRRKALNEQFTGLTGSDGLEGVQGPGGPLGRLKTLPPLGVLGGSIFDVQLRLRDLGAAATARDNSPATDSTTVDMLRELLRQANLRTAVSQAQFDVFKDFKIPGVLGAFAKGGVAQASGMYLVGEHGPELAHLRAGTSVSTAADTQQMLTPSFQVIINGDIVGTPAGKDPVEIVTNDRRFDAAVQRAVRGPSRNAGRGLPSRGGGNFG